MAYCLPLHPCAAKICSILDLIEDTRCSRTHGRLLMYAVLSAALSAPVFMTRLLSDRVRLWWLVWMHHAPDGRMRGQLAQGPRRRAHLNEPRPHAMPSTNQDRQ